MKIIIECTENEITAIQNILNSGRTLVDAFKKVTDKKDSNFEIKAKGNMSELIKELGLTLRKEPCPKDKITNIYTDVTGNKEVIDES